MSIFSVKKLSNCLNKTTTKMKTFFVFLLCLFAITFYCAYAQLEKNEDFQCPLADIRKMDKTVEKMISFTKNVRLFPETRANLTSYCK